MYICGGVVIELDDFKLLLDPWGPCNDTFDVVLVTHGHRDHIIGLPFYLDRNVKQFFMTKETFLIAQAQGVFDSFPVSRISNKLQFVKIGEEIDLKPGISLTALNSGHVVGGVMFRIETNHISVGYTGDFNYENTAVSDRADVLDTEILIMDTTYGDPSYIFPPRTILYEKIRETLKDLIEEGFLPILHGYSLGKGQELTKLTSLFVKGNIGVDKRVGLFNRIYENSTKNSLGKYSIGGKGDVYIRGIRGYKRKSGNHVHLFFTGWAAKRRYKAAMSFPLSSHSDFMGLLNYVIDNKPKFVYTLFSFARTFSKFIKSDLKIDSRPLHKKPVHIEIGKDYLKKARGKVSLDSFI